MSTLLQPKGIILHLTASTFGDSAQINDWHKAQGWSGIGYHMVVLNGVRQQGDTYNAALDGVVEPGRAEKIQGAHCKADSMNTCTLGISCVGTPNKRPTNAEAAPAQATTTPYLTRKQYQSLINSIAKWCIKYKLDPDGTFIHPTTQVRHPVLTQHSEHDTGKPLCASLAMGYVRQDVAQAVSEMPKAAVAALESFDSETPAFADQVLPEFLAPLGNQEGPDEPDSDLPVSQQTTPLTQ